MSIASLLANRAYSEAIKNPALEMGNREVQRRSEASGAGFGCDLSQRSFCDLSHQCGGGWLCDTCGLAYSARQSQRGMESNLVAATHLSKSCHST